MLELRLPSAPDEQTLADVALAAHALAYVVIANRRFTDLFEWGQRSVPLSLAAEIQHRLLPGAFTCEAGQFTLAGWLEPAGEIGGDTFDFSIERDTLHLSMTDAMGHDGRRRAPGDRSRRRAAQRPPRGRRAGRAGAPGQRRARRPRRTEAASSPGRSRASTCAPATATIVNAGHPLPLRLRDGRVETVALRADPPFGIVREPRVPGPAAAAGAGRPPDVPHRRHARAQRRQRRHRALMVASGADMHPREAVQHLIQALLEATGGELNDDATAMCLDWHGGPPGARGRPTRAPISDPARPRSTCNRMTRAPTRGARLAPDGRSSVWCEGQGRAEDGPITKRSARTGRIRQSGRTPPDR